MAIILLGKEFANKKRIKNKITLNKLLFAWLIISIINTYWLTNEVIETVFITKYAGHFILGILFYDTIINNKRSLSYIMLLPLSALLIFHNILGFTQWIRGAEYQELPYSETEIFLVFIFLICMFVYSAKEVTIHTVVAKYAHLLSAVSFPFYLVHADFGFFIRTVYYGKIINWFKFLQKIPSRLMECIIMLVAILASFLVALTINWLTSKKCIRKITKKM